MTADEARQLRELEEDMVREKKERDKGKQEPPVKDFGFVTGGQGTTQPQYKSGLSASWRVFKDIMSKKK